MSDQNKLTKDVTVRLVELLDAIDDAVERGAPQLGGFDFSALSVAHEEIIRLRTAAEPEQKILSWLKANARKGRSTVSINLASNGDITLDNLGLSDAEEARRQRIDEYHAEESKLPSLAKEIARSVEPRAEPFYVKHYVGQAHPSIKGNGFDGLTIGDEREEAQEFVDWVNLKIGVEAEKEPDEPAICEKCSQGLSTHHLIIDGAGNAAALCPVVTPPPNRQAEPDRKSALDEIVRISEEAGLYSDPAAAVNICQGCRQPMSACACASLLNRT